MTWPSLFLLFEEKEMESIMFINYEGFFLHFFKSSGMISIFVILITSQFSNLKTTIYPNEKHNIQRDFFSRSSTFLFELLEFLIAATET